MKETTTETTTANLKDLIARFTDDCDPWLTHDGFLCWQEPSLSNGADAHFRIDLVYTPEDTSNQARGSNHTLYLHASTLSKAMEALEIILDLPDKHFTQMTLSCCSSSSSSSSRRRDEGSPSPAQQPQPPLPCPLTPNLLQKFLQAKERQNMLSHMNITPEQARVLATQNVGLLSCAFVEDGGQAYCQALDPSVKKVTMDGTVPFDEKHWLQFLQQEKSSHLSLALFNIELDGPFLTAVARSPLKNLALCNCGFADHGTALLEAIRTGEGPQGLFFWDPVSWKPFESSEQWDLFFAALASSTRLTHLVLYSPPRTEAGENLLPLATALRRNRSLIHLKLSHATMNNQCWNQLMEAISTHPNIRSAQFSRITSPVRLPDGHLTAQEYCSMWLQQKAMARKHRTQSVKNMLLVNRTVEKMALDDETYDVVLWNKDIAPRLECNLYRNRFAALRRQQQQQQHHHHHHHHHRDALLGRALETVQGNPSLMLSLLWVNEDVLASRLLEASTTR